MDCDRPETMIERSRLEQVTVMMDSDDDSGFKSNLMEESPEGLEYHY